MLRVWPKCKPIAASAYAANFIATPGAAGGITTIATAKNARHLAPSELRLLRRSPSQSARRPQKICGQNIGRGGKQKKPPRLPLFVLSHARFSNLYRSSQLKEGSSCRVLKLRLPAHPTPRHTTCAPASRSS